MASGPADSSLPRSAIEHVRPDTLSPDPDHPRRINRKALSRLAALMNRHGFLVPVIARREDRRIVDGHHRIRANALRARPDDRVPVVFVDGLDDRATRLLGIALNNRVAQGRWDKSSLARLLVEAECDPASLAEATGFPPADVEDMTHLPPPGQATAAPEPVDQAGDPRTDGPVVVIFEMPRKVYGAARGELDALVGRYDVDCRVRL